MARRPRNGEGEAWQINVSFNEDEVNDAYAREMAAQLARSRDLSAVIKGFLLALYEYQERTGRPMTAERAMGLFLSGSFLGNEGVWGYTEMIEPEDPGIIVSSAESADPDDVLDAFAGSFGDDDPFA